MTMPMLRYLLLSFALAAGAVPLAAQPQGGSAGEVVARSNLRLRATPSASARVVSSVPRGYPVLLRECGGGWCEVMYMGVRGYALAEQLTRGRTPPPVLPEADPATSEPGSDREEGARREGRARSSAEPAARRRPAGPLRPLCKGALDEASAAFEDGAFQDAIGVLSRCAGDGTLSAAESATAYRLLALAYVHEGNEREAELAVLRLVGIEPAYEPDDRLDPPAYIALVRRVKVELKLVSMEDVRCDEALDRARSLYLQELFAEVDEALSGCLSDSRLSEHRLVRVHRLAALARMKRGDLAAAQEAISDLLLRVPDYRADPVQDLPALVALVETARERRARARPKLGW